ncbi:MAG: sulfite exporter TauE/SafE family protein [Desulforhopalus sp.]
MDLPLAVILSFVSFIAGLINGISGGGGLILLGALLLSGIPPQTAIATNKFIATIGYTSALYNFINKKLIRWDILLYSTFYIVVGAILGARLATVTDEHVFAKFISLLFPIAIIFVFYIPTSSNLQLLLGNPGLNKMDKYLKLPLIGLVIGFYNGIFGPGTITIIILCLHYFIKVDVVKGLAAAGVLNWISNWGAVITFNHSDHLLFSTGLILSISNILGSYIGSNMAIKNGTPFIKHFLVFSLSISFIYIGLKYWRIIDI